MKFAAILFDLDGTLMDSESLWVAAESEFLISRGKILDPILHAPTHGASVIRSMEIMREAYGLEDEVADMVIAIQTRVKVLLATEAKPKPGAQEIMEYMEKHAIPCALVSNSAREIVELTIANQPWKHVFSAICPVEVAANPKPAPDLYLYAAQALGVNSQDCLVIEDSPNGAKAAVTAGATCYGLSENPSIFEGITPYVFDSLHDILNTFIHPKNTF